LKIKKNLIDHLALLYVFAYSQSVSYFNVIEYTRETILREINFSQRLFLAAIVLITPYGCRSGNP